MSDDEIRLSGPPVTPSGPAPSDSGGGRIQVWSHVLNEIDEHVESDTTVEQGGVLLGTVDEASGTTVISARIPALGAISEVASLRFTHETWDHINDVMERDHPTLKMVGWYHSHPHFGIFLSEYDQFIHNNFFSQPWQVAYVVDPLLRQRGFFAWVDGELVRVPTWETWRTESGTPDVPVGTPPPRPEAPAEAPPAAGPVPGGPQANQANRVSPWSLGLLAVLVIALFGAVLALANPFDSDEQVRIVVTEPLEDQTATASTVTPLGRVQVEGAEGVQPSDFTYHPTDDNGSPPDAVEVERDGDGFVVSWRSASLDDTGPRSGELRLSVCDEEGDRGACPPGHLVSASTPVSLTLAAPQGGPYVAPAPEAFATAAGLLPFAGEQGLSTEQPSVEALGTLTLPGGTTVYQLDADAVPDPAALLPHLGFEATESAEPPGDVAEQRERLGLEAIGSEPVAIIDATGAATREATLACGQVDGGRPSCLPEDDGTEVTSILTVLDEMGKVPDGSVAAVLLPMPDGSCPTTPTGTQDALELLATAMSDRPEVLWVVAATSRCLVDVVADVPNAVLVATPEATDIDLDAVIPFTVDGRPADPASDLPTLDGAALTAAVAARVWASVEGLDPAAVIDCVRESPQSVDDAVARCVPETKPPATAPEAPEPDPDDEATTETTLVAPATEETTTTTTGSGEDPAG